MKNRVVWPGPKCLCSDFVDITSSPNLRRKWTGFSFLHVNITFSVLVALNFIFHYQAHSVIFPKSWLRSSATKFLSRTVLNKDASSANNFMLRATS